MTQILQPTPSNLDQLAAVLANGEIAAIPTETVYGLAGNALNPASVAKIYQAKGRPARNPLIVHIGELEQLNEIAVLPKSGVSLISAFWPGPLTLILKKKPIVPDSVTAGLDTVAVRMPAHPVFQQLAKRCPFPLAAPSANPFGYVSPTKARHVKEQMGDKIDWVLDGGDCEGGIESTILSLIDDDNPTLLRHGSITSDQLSQVLGQPVAHPDSDSADTGESLIAPGLMKRHYSPETRVELFEGSPYAEAPNSAVVYLNQQSCKKDTHFGLSEKGNLEEVARNLYSTLQELDKRDFQLIILELPKDEGIGSAVRDRMTRAAAR